MIPARQPTDPFGPGGLRSAGFTLIELLIGMAILAAAALLVLPEARRVVAGRTLDAAASELASVARMTRAAAVSSGSERALVIDLDRRRYWADGITGPRQLPARVSMALGVPMPWGASEQPHIVRFLPGGSSTGAQIVLGSGARRITVVIDWFTGGARVSS